MVVRLADESNSKQEFVHFKGKKKTHENGKKIMLIEEKDEWGKKVLFFICVIMISLKGKSIVCFVEDTPN